MFSWSVSDSRYCAFPTNLLSTLTTNHGFPLQFHISFRSFLSPFTYRPSQRLPLKQSPIFFLREERAVMSTQQHLSVAQAASALEAVAAAANALARGSELPSLLQFQGMVRNNHSGGSPSGRPTGQPHQPPPHPQAAQYPPHPQGDGGLAELRSRLNTTPSVDPQHVAKSLEGAILRGNALLDEDFLTNLNANEGRLVNSLEHSAGSVPTTSSFTCDDDDMVRHGDKTYPAWPPKRSSSASASPSAFPHERGGDEMPGGRPESCSFSGAG